MVDFFFLNTHTHVRISTGNKWNCVSFHCFMCGENLVKQAVIDGLLKRERWQSTEPSSNVRLSYWHLKKSSQSLLPWPASDVLLTKALNFESTCYNLGELTFFLWYIFHQMHRFVENRLFTPLGFDICKVARSEELMMCSQRISEFPFHVQGHE